MILLYAAIFVIGLCCSILTTNTADNANILISNPIKTKWEIFWKY